MLPESENYNLDPLLVFSLIRQESLFEGFATSYAAAQGLMQIIPDTGQWIAQKLSWPNYQNSDVYRPYINVKFGAYYLRYVLDLVDNLPYAALAGYGAGECHQWLGILADLDLVQTIGYDGSAVTCAASTNTTASTGRSAVLTPLPSRRPMRPARTAQSASRFTANGKRYKASLVTVTIKLEECLL